MAGFDFEKARTTLNVPDTFAVAAMFVVGHAGKPEELPPELRQREQPSSRRPVQESICEGPFKVGPMAG
jgi:hypothetical protein